MGLGKTHQAMALMAAISNLILPKKAHFLVVCPTSVIYHWQDKLTAFLPHLRVQLFHGLKRKLSAPTQGGVIVTTYGIVRLQKEMFADLEIQLAIYDEIQLAKNPKSGTHKGLRAIKAHMHLGLTGTPIENNLSELKALFDIVLPQYLPKEALFRSQYIYPIERDNDEEKKAQLTKLIKPFTLRRRKSEVLQELPSKSEDRIYCDLSEEQEKIYGDVLEERRRSLLQTLRDPEEKIPYMHIFSLLSSLKQICNHPALYAQDVEHYKKYDSSKWELFMELLTEALESEQKVVVFSQYLQMLDIMETYLQEKHIGYAQIRGDTQDRRRQLEKFQNEEGCKVFLGSLQAAGLGIDLTAASVVILYDRWWNSARENQAIDRVHRMGQKWGVQVYKLITKGTIEESIDKMITKKGQLMEEIITVDDQSTLKSLSRDELIALLEPA
jgi:SNF2 family DNA or RNA helicase